MKTQIIFLFLFLSFAFSATAQQMTVGSEQTDAYLPLLKGKRIAVVANQTTVVGKTHLVDTLLALDINIVKIFSPEHGFRGQAEAGAAISNEIDTKTNLPIISLYGKNKELQGKDIQDVDLLIFDIQDVGARFYTYISTLHYVMQTCADNDKPLLILDRPNPNGFYVDGPILQSDCSSFVGMHPVPIVHGMTIAEYALMINGERWLKDGSQCRLKYILVKNYTHDSLYTLPIPPSPNLQTMEAIYLYPSLCWFEGTTVSVGRGTEKPFQIIGSPYTEPNDFFFTPEPIKGVSENPPFKGGRCYGFDLSNEWQSVFESKKINLSYLERMYRLSIAKENFFTSFFDKLAGNKDLKQQIKQGLSEKEIRNSWQKDLNAYKQMRKQYLLYPDFN